MLEIASAVIRFHIPLEMLGMSLLSLIPQMLKGQAYVNRATAASEASQGGYAHHPAKAFYCNKHIQIDHGGVGIVLHKDIWNAVEDMNPKGPTILRAILRGNHCLLGLARGQRLDKSGFEN